jgi:hypothetical protein
MKSVQIYRDYGLIDQKLISNFESSKDIIFPRIYVDLIKNHNGMRLEESCFNFKNLFTYSHVWSYKIEDEIDSREMSFFGFGNEIPSYKQIESPSFDIYGHDHIVAFGYTANGDYVCFDYRHDPKTSEPRIVVMFHDAYDENRKMLICPVANSFEEFMDSLYKPAD